MRSTGSASGVQLRRFQSRSEELLPKLRPMLACRCAREREASCLNARLFSRSSAWFVDWNSARSRPGWGEAQMFGRRRKKRSQLFGGPTFVRQCCSNENLQTPILPTNENAQYEMKLNDLPSRWLVHLTPVVKLQGPILAARPRLS
jgi:hypothetical protein